MRERRRVAANSSSAKARIIPASLRPEANSTSRNCIDWKPLAGLSWSRKPRKLIGVIVSRTCICATRSFSISTTRRSARVAAGGRSSPIAQRAGGGVQLVENLFEPEFVCLVDGDEEKLVVVRGVGQAGLQVYQLA